MKSSCLSSTWSSFYFNCELILSHPVNVFLLLSIPVSCDCPHRRMTWAFDHFHWASPGYYSKSFKSLIGNLTKLQYHYITRGYPNLPIFFTLDYMLCINNYFLDSTNHLWAFIQFLVVSDCLSILHEYALAFGLNLPVCWLMLFLYSSY